jgi:hypothetical protein
MLQPTDAPAPSSRHTHFVRGGSLMLQPTDAPAPSSRHTHLVRGGSLMLQPFPYLYAESAILGRA